MSGRVRESLTTHSKKPQIFYDILTRNTPEPRIDVFARMKRYGWDTFGDDKKLNAITLETFVKFGSDKPLPKDRDKKIIPIPIFQSRKEQFSKSFVVKT